jgi:hypothetical protein
MARQQGPFDWQGRLESDGSVTFGPGRWSSWVLLGVAVLALLFFAYAVVSDGPALWSVLGVAVLAACAVVTGRAAVLGTSRLTITHDGFGLGGQEPVAFDRLGAVAIARRNLTIHYRSEPTGQKRMMVALPRFGPFHPDDLAVWLLKLKGGPAADVVEQKQPLGRVFQLRDHRPD